MNEIKTIELFQKQAKINSVQDIGLKINDKSFPEATPLNQIGITNWGDLRTVVYSMVEQIKNQSERGLKAAKEAKQEIEKKTFVYNGQQVFNKLGIEYSEGSNPEFTYSLNKNWIQHMQPEDIIHQVLQEVETVLRKTNNDYQKEVKKVTNQKLTEKVA